MKRPRKYHLVLAGKTCFAAVPPFPPPAPHPCANPQEKLQRSETKRNSKTYSRILCKFKFTLPSLDRRVERAREILSPARRRSRGEIKQTYRLIFRGNSLERVFLSRRCLAAANLSGVPAIVMQMTTRGSVASVSQSPRSRDSRFRGRSIDLAI